MDAHIAKWAAHLGLADWHIRYSPAEPDPDAHAQTNCFAPHKQAAIRLEATLPVSQIDRKVVHELLHVSLWEVQEAFNQAVAELSVGQRDTLMTLQRDASERLIESMVDALTGIPRVEALNEGHDHHVWNSAFPLI